MWIVIGAARAGVARAGLPWLVRWTSRARPRRPVSATDRVSLSGGREAVVVDPPRDAWRVIAAAEARGWRITHVVETHVHNDYLSGALELRSALGAEIVAPARGRYAFAHRPVDEGDALEIDGLRLTARADARPHARAPGLGRSSTDGSDGPAAVADRWQPARRQRRPDRPARRRPDRRADPRAVPIAARAGGAARRRRRAADPRCRQLLRGRAGRRGPDDHDRPGASLATRSSRSTTRSAFRATLLDGLGPYPRYYARDGADQPGRAAGRGSAARRPGGSRPTRPRRRSPAAHTSSTLDRGATFAAGHIRGSLNIELGDSFASYVGWFVPFGAAVVLVLPDPVEDALVEATTQLFRIGYDRIVGVLDGGVEAWTAAGGSVSSYPVVVRAGDRGRARERLAPAPARRPRPARVARRRHRPRRDRALDRRPRGPAREPAARRADHRDVQDRVARVDRREHARRRRVRRPARGRAVAPPIWPLGADAEPTSAR